MRICLVLILIGALAACAPVASRTDGDILVIGDSVMAWNRTSGEDIGSVIGATLGRETLNRSMPGAQIRINPVASLVGLSIPDQLPDSRWNWVVMNGGANDLGFSCDCTKCEAEIEALISQDATGGDIPDLIAQARGQGAQVLWMGYYRSPRSTSFKGCRPGLEEIERRIALYSQQRDGVFFLDTESVFEPPVPALFASDSTHPSAQGSAIIGKFLAELIAAESPAVLSTEQ